jgi:hypothetical protein
MFSLIVYIFSGVMSCKKQNIFQTQLKNRGYTEIHLFMNDCKNLYIYVFCNPNYIYFRILSANICMCKHFDYFCRSNI